MTKKAWIYSGVGAVVLVAGYFNYFGEDKKLDTLKKVIETSSTYPQTVLLIQIESLHLLY